MAGDAPRGGRRGRRLRRICITPVSSEAWIHSVIQGSRLNIFETKQGGYHFVFLENPEGFKELVAFHMMETSHAEG